jgi:Xaa-Pro aminopeptidase
MTVIEDRVDMDAALVGIDLDAMRTARLARAKALMAKHKLDAVLAFEYANGRYLADLRPLWAPNFLVRQAVVATPKADDVIVFVHQDDTPHRQSTMPWIKPANIREFPTAAVSTAATSGPLAPLGAALSELGFSGGRVGVDIVTPLVLGNLRRLLPDADIVDLGPCMHEARSVKNEQELALLRIASRVVDVAMAVATATVAPGVKECEVLAEVMRVFYRHGAEVPQCNLIVCSGPNTAPMQRFAGDRRIEEGDLVFMDVGACFNGIFSEATRTIACGTPNAEQRKIYRTVVDINEATIASIRAGIPAEDVKAAAAAPYHASDYTGRMQRMIIAHGIGVGYAEPPFIPPPDGPSTDLVLESGMVLAVVPTILVPGVPGGGGVRLEDIVIVGTDGPERLTAAPYDDSLLA